MVNLKHLTTETNTIVMKTTIRYLILASSFSLAFAVPAQPIQIGYTNCLEVASYSQSLMDRITQLRWFFAHASVGGNMVDGVNTLHGSKSSFYQIQTTSEDGTPPSSTQNGFIYEYNRGNPSASAKFNNFAGYVTNGWRFPKVHLSLNKLCYIDQDASLSECIGTMRSLESAFPETVFVYMTMPLTTSTDSDNYKRNVFNDGLRNWTRTNNLVLFDVADIEAHSPTGTLCLYTNNGRVCQYMYGNYSSDGGHLNSTGEKLVAAGFYALGAALFSTDRDGDGQCDGDELIAGTLPTRLSSCFRVDAKKATNNSISLTWSSATNRLYTLQRSTNLTGTAGFSTLITNFPATPPLNAFLDSPSGTGPFFYRLQVSQ